MEKIIEKRFKVLVVDDNPLFVITFKNLIKNTLGENLEAIEVADNGKEGLDKIKNTVFDYIFMDVDMPVMDGVKATNIANKEYRGLNIIAISYHEELKIIQDMFMAGARHFIKKSELNNDSIKKFFEISLQ